MELALNFGYLTKDGRSLAQSARWAREAGFKYLDYLSSPTRDDWEDNARRERALFDAEGLTVEQTHIPFNRYHSYPDSEFPELCRRAVEISSILGAKYAVIHADEYRVGEDGFDADTILAWTLDYLKPYAEQCAKHGLVLAVENLFEDKGRNAERTRFTSTTDELLGVIQGMNSPMVRCCWDFGHAKCSFGAEGQLAALEKLTPYLVCTHTHDNYYEKDLHLLPFLGDTDWEAHMALLKKSGYEGKLSYEFVYGHIPDALMPAALTFARSTGEYLTGLFDRAAK